MVSNLYDRYELDLDGQRPREKKGRIFYFILFTFLFIYFFLPSRARCSEKKKKNFFELNLGDLSSWVPPCKHGRKRQKIKSEGEIFGRASKRTAALLKSFTPPQYFALRPHRYSFIYALPP